MIITNGKILYYFYMNSRDMIYDEIATEEALKEFLETFIEMGGCPSEKGLAETRIRAIMTIVPFDDVQSKIKL